MSANPTRGAPPTARGSNPLKATMIGVAGPAQAPPRAAPGRGAEASKDARPAPPHADLPSIVSDKTPLTGLGDADMPALPTRENAPVGKGESASGGADFPAVPRPKPPPPARAAASIESDLPAALGGRPKAPPRSPPRVGAPTEPERPAIASAAANSDDAWALPELAKEPPLVTPATLNPAVDDLAYPPRPAKPDISLPSIDVDLPQHKDSKFSQKPDEPAPDDLEIALPSPAEAMSGWNQSPSEASEFDVELDLPSPAGAGLPLVSRVDLPSMPKGALPAVSKSKAGTAHGEVRGFGEVDLLPDIESGAIRAGSGPSPSAMIPDLDAPLGLESHAAGTHARGLSQPPTAKRFDLPDLTDVLPTESLPPHANGDSSASALKAHQSSDQQFGVEFGELSLEESTASGDTSRINSNDERPVAIVRKSGGGTAFGEVSLDEGGDTEALIGTLDDAMPRQDKIASGELEFGEVPQEMAPVGIDGNTAPEFAAAPSRKDHPQRRASAAPRPERRPASRALKYGALGFVVVLVLGGASLSLIPDVGLFGYSFISDQIRKPEYARLLVRQVVEAQQALSSDVYPLAVRAIA